jgi:hypothetical protein
MTLLNARSIASELSSTPISRAISTKRLNCSGSSGWGFGLRGIMTRYAGSVFYE